MEGEKKINGIVFEDFIFFFSPFWRADEGGEAGKRSGGRHAIKL